MVKLFSHLVLQSHLNRPEKQTRKLRLQVHLMEMELDKVMGTETETTMELEMEKMDQALKVK